MSAVKTIYDTFKIVHDENGIISFESSSGEFCSKIFLLQKDIVRVIIYQKKQESTLPNTWWVVYGQDDVEYEGNLRLDVPTELLLQDYVISETDEFYEIKFQEKTLVIQKKNFIISWQYNDVNLLQDRPTQAYNFNCWDDAMYHYVCREHDDMYFGCGEKTGELNKYGQSYKMTNLDPMGYDAQITDPLYKQYPFYITYKQNLKSFLGIFYDNFAISHFNFGREHDNYHKPYAYFKTEDKYLDYYVFMGQSVQDIVKRFTWLTGRVRFLPKWSLGYSGSTMLYTDNPDSQKKLYQFLEDCKKHDIPCDSFQLSSGYTSIDDKRYVFNWNKEKFPNPKKLFQDFLDAGIKFCANIKPCLLKSHPKYEECKDFFIKTNDGKISTSQFWDEEGSYLDFTNEKARQWWATNVQKQLLQYGVQSTWNDNNEFEIWDNNIVFKETGAFTPRVLQTLLMVKTSFLAQQEFDKESRPYLISRSGCPGLQRYGQSWTGDNYTSFKTLEYNVYMGLGLSLSGMYNIGHDVGGFSGDAPDEELFTRWVQHGIFYPRFTIHSWNSDGTVNVPWMYEDSVDVIREAMHLRCKLMPYLYNLLYETSCNFNPIIRPLFYNYEGDIKCFDKTTDFMLGDDVLVSSVIKEGETKHSTYFPKGDDWYAFSDNTYHHGGSFALYDVNIKSNPCFIRAGSTMFFNKGISFKHKDGTAKEFVVYPKETGNSHSSYFEDDGISYKYLEKVFVKYNIDVRTDNENIKITLSFEGKGNQDTQIEDKRVLSIHKEIYIRVINPGNKKIILDTNMNNVYFDDSLATENVYKIQTKE